LGASSGKRSDPAFENMIRIEVRKPSKASLAGNYGIRSDWYAGSGFVATNGLIVTCAHTIAGAAEILVYTPSKWATDSPYKWSSGGIEVCVLDPATDIAILRVSAPPIGVPVAATMQVPASFTTCAQSDGQPWRTNAGTVTAQFSSAELKKAGAERPNLKTSILVFSAPVGPGSSGAALISDRGEVLGMVHGGLHLGATGSNFAIPASAIRAALAQADKSNRCGISPVYRSADFGALSNTYEGLLALNPDPPGRQRDSWFSLTYVNQVGLALAEGPATGIGVGVSLRRSPRFWFDGYYHYIDRSARQAGTGGETQTDYREWSVSGGPRVLFAEFWRIGFHAGGQIGVRRLDREMHAAFPSTVYAPQQVVEEGVEPWLSLAVAVHLQVTETARVEVRIAPWWAPFGDMSGTDRSIGIGVAFP